MKGFKYLLLAAESGDRSSMIIAARAFDTGINLSADRSVKVVLIRKTCLSYKDDKSWSNCYDNTAPWWNF